MKRLLIISCLLLLGLQANAEFVTIETNVTMDNFWEKNGKDTHKVLMIAQKVINANKLPKRVNVMLYPAPKTPNACALYRDKTVYVYSGLLPYIDNDDEMGFILSHEMAHSMDHYDGPMKLVSMTFNSKEYENKADLIGIDMMVKSGFNPISAICVMNKISSESIWDTWIFASHPKGSVRLMNMYKYIYKKYPEALNSEMVKNVNYQNFTYSSKKEIEEFNQREKHRTENKTEDL